MFDRRQAMYGQMQDVRAKKDNVTILPIGANWVQIQEAHDHSTDVRRHGDAAYHGEFYRHFDQPVWWEQIDSP